MMRLLLLIPATLLMVACFGGNSKKMEKSFPIGDHYEDMAVKHGSGLPPGPTEAPAPEKRLHLPNRPTERGMILVVKPDATVVDAGEAINVEMIVRNTNSGAEPLTYATGKRFDLALFYDKEQANPVYVWSDGRMFTQAFQETMVGGGASMVRELEIQTVRSEPTSGRGGLSDPIGPGVYYLWGVHEGEPYLATGPIELVVRGE